MVGFDLIITFTKMNLFKAEGYKRVIKRAEYLFRKGRGMVHQIYLDQEDLFQQQDSLSESVSTAFDHQLLMGSLKS